MPHFKITWVFDGKIYTRSGNWPCNTIAEVLKAFQNDCIILHAEDLKETEKYKHLPVIEVK